VIFVTVREQLPFDRLIRVMDQWAVQQPHRIFAQIGRSSYRPSHIEYKQFLEQREFRQRMQEAQFIVAHAGMGTIISALEMGKPIIVMPRRASLGEHRNDHQLTTARRFLSLQYVLMALDENELWQRLSDMATSKDFQWSRRKIGSSPILIKTIRDFMVSD